VCVCVRRVWRGEIVTFFNPKMVPTYFYCSFGLLVNIINKYH